MMQRPPDGKQTQLKLAPFFAKKMRRIFGYIVEITLSEGDGTETPAQLQIVSRIPGKYGQSRLELERSWAMGLGNLILFILIRLLNFPNSSIRVEGLVPDR